MGRPKRCCRGCEPPTVECYIESGYYYYTITNADRAYFNLDNAENAITLDSEGNASGLIPTSTPGIITFKVVAINECGTATCEKTCYALFCYLIYKLGDVDHTCAGSARLDTVTIEFFMSIAWLSGGDYPLDLNTAKFYLNGTQVSATMQTKAIPCYSDAVTGLFGQVTVDRCDLADTYSLTIDVNGECGSPVGSEGETYLLCQGAWSPVYIDKQNSGIIEVDFDGGYDVTSRQEQYAIFIGQDPTKIAYIAYVRAAATGLDAFNGTYILPIKCSLNNRTDLCGTQDGLDPRDVKKLAMPSTTIDVGNLVFTDESDAIYPMGSGGFTSYSREYRKTIREGYGRIYINGSTTSALATVAFRLIPVRTTKESITESHIPLAGGGVAIAKSTSSSICTALAEPYPPCPGTPGHLKTGSCVTTTVNTYNGVETFRGTNTGNICTNDTSGTFSSSLGNQVVVCLPNGTGGWIVPSFNNINSDHGTLGGTTLRTIQLCYDPTERTCYLNKPGVANGCYPNPLTGMIPFGQIRSYYDCL